MPGLVPVNFDQNFEFYLGIRNPQTHKYTGDRLFYDNETKELAPASGEQAHEDNQMWTFQRAQDYPKGVHAIVAVDAEARFSCDLQENEEDEEGTPFVNM